MKLLLLLAALPLTAAEFTVTSGGVSPTGDLRAEFTCDGERASPPLAWTNAPEGTRSFAVTMHHIPPDGGEHVYLVVYGIPGTVTSLARNSRDVGHWGINTVNRQPEYTPPCSQGPGPKTYTLTVFALSAEPALNGRVTREGLLKAIESTTLATAKLEVTYARAGNRNATEPPPTDFERALARVALSADQEQAVQSALRDYREKQRQLREGVLKQLKVTLSPEQYAQVESGLRQPPRPRP